MSDIENQLGLTDEQIAEDLGTTKTAVEAGEAPANEITTLTNEPVETVETTPPEPEPVQEVQEENPAVEAEEHPVENEESIAPDVEIVHSENEPESDQNVAELAATNPESTSNDNVVEIPTATPATTPEPTVPVDNWQQYVQSISMSGNTNLMTILSTVDMYYSIMKPRMPITIAMGTDAQANLWRAILNTIRNNNTNFSEAWNLWLNIFNHYNDSIFSITYAFRFFEYIKIPRDQIIAFQRILNLLILTANATNRKSVVTKQIDLERTMSVYFTEADRMKIMNFYLG